ncbi:glycosyltransferase family 2 protein [Candidatus Saccharibacteria bacterium]|nr:glycosyltransferase family 2 protein [Candidatus Saccharibacteria bacterium]
MSTNTKKIQLSLVMPCLNEEAAVAGCIKDGLDFFKKRKINGEIIVVDNNSTDNSAIIATECGARVVREEMPGYGSALRKGLASAKGERIIMGDCDQTYDFLHLDEMYDYLAEYDFVIGDRFRGGIHKKAMPLSHHIGVRALSLAGRLRYGIKVHDYHCGIRGIRKDALEKVDYKTTGMEFATEMIAEAGRKKLSIKEIPVELRRGAEGRTPKLRTIRDGFRHLKYIIVNP